MKNRFFTVILLMILVFSLTGNARATPPTSTDTTALVYVDLGSTDALNSFAYTRLPMYSMLERGLLTGADQIGQQTLQKVGLPYRVIDPDMQNGTYYFANTLPGRSAPDYASYGQVLLDTSSGVLLRMDPTKADPLSQAGAELRLITLTPKPLPATQRVDSFPDVVDPDPLIQVMMDQVSTDQIYEYTQGLAGEIPVWVDEGWTTINSRNTNSGGEIQKATHYVGEHMSDLGMGVEYHTWDDNTNPNVIGEIPGLVNPDDIFIIGGHLDDVQFSPGGADDNASGSVAALIASDILSQYQWGCTLRFAFWTGEEQGLVGSGYYAQRSYNMSENIVGYLNLDMIAWNTINSAPGIDVIYNPNMPPTLGLAQLFEDVIGAYSLDLEPQLITDLGGGSDHSSFWDYGYTAILSIEDQNDFNPYYHGPGDTTAHTDPVFFTNFVKASVGTFAHMSDCLIPSGIGHLDGHVTDSSTGLPIEGASVIADDGLGHSFPATTDSSGYYTRTLLSGTYTTTASAYSYLPFSVDHVVVTTDTVTTQDFVLVSAPTYVISGTVTESGTGVPLFAEIKFIGSPVTVSTNPGTGYYQAELPQGSYTMQVKADLHNPQERDILVDHDQTQNFLLDPLPCILLVDDDNNSPNTTPYYTAALDSLGYDYNIFSTEGGNGPSIENLMGYRMVMWYSGDGYGGSAGPNGADEDNLSLYLDGGGKLFLDSQDYLYDFSLTPFGQNYLGIGSYNNDTGDATSIIGLPGDPIGNGLGPYNLTYPSGFSDYGDNITVGAGASAAFKANNNTNKLAVDKAGEDWKTVFFGTSWVPLYNNNASNGEIVLQRMIDWFGGCQQENGWLEGHITDAVSGESLEGVQLTTTPGNFQSVTDPSGSYIMPLPAGTYTVTASLDGYDSLSQSITINAGEGTTLDFALQPICAPVSGLDFSWLPVAPFEGDVITFTATATGTEPVEFKWSFGDTFTSTGTTVTHAYAEANTYSVELYATNVCSTASANKDITVLQRIWELFLPLLSKN